jgi:DNA-binding transcriptional LysR family regulator
VQLDLSSAVVTRHIADLERRLRTRLLNRNTRSLSLTESGQFYLGRARHILEKLEDAERTVADHSHKPMGPLRIVAPVVFAQHHLAPALHSYRQSYPRVLSELTLVDRDFDLFGEGYDVGIVPASAVPGNGHGSKTAGEHGANGMRNARLPAAPRPTHTPQTTGRPGFADHADRAMG